MNNKYLFPIIVFITLVILAIFVFLDSQDNNQTTQTTPIQEADNGIILYISNGCPYCQVVEDYLTQKNTSEKVAFIMKNVDNNLVNSKEFMEKATICGFTSKEIGVPFLWTGESCLVGSPDIIEFFENKTE
jgi:glutaredoxin